MTDAPSAEPLEQRTSPRFNPMHEAPVTEKSLRHLPAILAWLGAAGLVGMSAYHLHTGTFGELPTIQQRAVHLTFALALAFLLFPLLKRYDRWWILVCDIILGLAAASAAAYVAIFDEQLARRAGAPTTPDLIVAGLGIVLVLEATRRTVSPALFGVALAFLAYALGGHMLPGELGHYGLRVTQILEYQFFTYEGIFGTPLGVSATFVFLFVLFGAILERSGAGQYLIDLAFAAMGRYRGGPAKAAVCASGFMGTVSGSSVANTVTTGALTVPLMKKTGFQPHVAGAVEVAASINGQLMPPVMGAAAFIMAEFTNIPYAAIIVAALLPAILSYTVIFAMIHLEALRSGIQPGDRATLPRFWRTVARGLHLNIPFIALLSFLLILFYTPSASATYTIWVCFALFLVVCLVAPPTAYGLRRKSEEEQAIIGDDNPQPPEAWTITRRLYHFLVRSGQAMRDGALNMVGIACACACCGIIIGVVSQTGLAAKITVLIETLSGGNLLAALFFTALACLVLGIGIPTTANYIIMASLAAPAVLDIAQMSGLERTTTLLLATHLFVFYYGILADSTPPVGLAAYAVSGISGADPIRTGITAFRFNMGAFLLPFIFFFNTELLMQDVTWLQALWVLPGALIGMMCFAAAIQGHLRDPLRWWQRLLFVAVAFLLVKPVLVFSLAGLALLAITLATTFLLPRKAANSQRRS